MNDMPLRSLGMGPFFDEPWRALMVELTELAAPGVLTPARVAADFAAELEVLDLEGSRRAVLSGKLRLAIERGGASAPAVGDFVALAREPGGSLVVRAVLPRRSHIRRRSAGTRPGEQVLAANVDVAFVTAGLDNPVVTRRLERLVLLAREGSVRPVVLLTKTDLVPHAARRRDEIAAALPDTDVLAVSAFAGGDVAAVMAFLGPTRTAVFLGPSGAGKSTLVNELVGAARQPTGDVRSDSKGRHKGRHTTTHRQLLVLPDGGLVIDTPGVREVGLVEESDAGLGEEFAEVEALAAACRFSDCGHDTEPGCAVREAVADGALAPERLTSFQRLVHEADAHAALDDKRSPLARARRARERRMSRALTARIQQKRR